MPTSPSSWDLTFPRAAAALGTLRLADLPRDRAAALIRRALDRGVRCVDTADVYGADGAGERAVRDALDGWRGDPVRVITKVGLVRDRVPWTPDGRRKHLLEAADRSAERLGRPPDLLLLHAPDPRTPLSTSVRALATVRDRGLAGAIGVSNVRRHELREARDLGADAVQVALSPRDDAALRGGVVGWALENGLLALVHSPLGGAKGARALGKHPALRGVAEAVGRSPWAVAAAWLASLGVTPVVGPTTAEHLDDLLPPPELTPHQLAVLDAAFPAAHLVRSPMEARRPPPDAAGDVVLLMGGPASGKSTDAARFVAEGYHRLNRDLLGGTLVEVADALDRALAEGQRRVILDNTYPERAQRNRVIETAWRHGVPVRCLHKATPLPEAAFNACVRLIRRHGRLLEPHELVAAGKKEPNTFPPRVLLQWPNKLEEPHPDEGFAEVVTVPFARASLGPHRALVLDAGAIAADHVALAQRYRDAGWLVVAAGWTGGGPAPGDVRVGDAIAETAWCTHPTGPPVCWCRPPLPGLVAWLAIRHGLGEVRTPADPPPWA